MRTRNDRARRILLVEDSPADAALLSRYLLRGEEDVYEIANAASGEIGLELIAASDPDVVLLDFDLPDLDGLEFLEMLHRRHGERAPVVLAITGQSDPRIAAELIRRGALDYIAKRDLTEDALRLAVRQAVRTRQMREDLERRTQERERSRAELEASLVRASYVASVSEVLMRSLDANAVLQTVAVLSFPHLGDGCFVDILEDGALRRQVVEIGGPLADRIAKGALLRAPSLEGSEGVGRALRSGAAATYRGSWLPAVGRWDPGIAALVAAGAIGSLIVVPLVFDEQALGALSFVSVRPHDDHAQEVAEEIGRRVSAALANAHAFQRQRAASEASEAARRRMLVVSRVSDVFFRSLDWRAALENVAELLVPSFCDRAVIAVEVDGAKVVALAPDHQRAFAEEGPSFGVPITASTGATLGTLTVGGRLGRRFSADDVTVAEDIGRRAGMFLENARLFERERDIARGLQTSLLPLGLPQIEHVELAARCIAGVEGIDVGGDWYDVVRLPAGKVAFAVGDVAGRGVLAAAAMGQLRSSLRAYALEGLEPGDALARLNAFVLSQERAPWATVGLGVFDPHSGVVRYASAGHLPPLVVEADGTATLLQTASSLPVGLEADTFYEQSEHRLAPGATVTLYTDGLVESRTRPIDAGLTEMLAVARDERGTTEAFVEALLHRLAPDAAEAADDVTVLTLRYVPDGMAREAPDGARTLAVTYPGIASSAAAVRHRLRRFLEECGFSEERIHEVQLAAGEAVANAVEHAYAGAAQPGLVTLRASCADGRLVVEVSDHGLWRQNPRPIRPTLLAERGRGMVLMRAMADEVHLDHQGAGTRVRLAFQRAS